MNLGVSTVSTPDLICQLELIYCGTLSAQFQQLSVSSSICVSLCVSSAYLCVTVCVVSLSVCHCVCRQPICVSLCVSSAYLCVTVCRQPICCCFIMNILKHALNELFDIACLLQCGCERWTLTAHTERTIEAFTHLLQRAQDKLLCQAANCQPCWRARATARNHQKLKTLLV